MCPQSRKFLRLMILTSKDNEKIKFLKSLITSKKARKASDVFCVEGENILKNISPEAVYCTESFFLKNEALLDGVELHLISENLAGYLSDTPSPQGVFSVFKRFERECGDPETAVVLESLQDEGNLGTVIRTAAALGFSEIILTGCPDRFSPKVIRSSAGAVLSACIREFPNIEAAAGYLKAAGFTIYGAVPEDGAKALGSFEFSVRPAVLLGNEGNGLSKAALSICDETVAIPMQNHIDSLNAAVCGGIFMWEIVKNVRT